MTRTADSPAPSSLAGRLPWLLAVLVVAWSPRLVPGSFATDDLAFMNVEPDPGTMLQQGRPGQALLYAVFRALGAHPVHAGSLLNWVAIGLLALTSLGLLRVWRVTPTLLSVLCISLAFVHPNLAETFTFRFTPVFFAVAMALAIGGLVLAHEGAPIRGGLLVLVSLTVYQITLNTLLTVLALGVVLDCLRGSTGGAALRGWWRPAAVVGVAAALYLVLQRLAAAALGSSVQGGRARFISLEAVPDRLRALGPVFRRVLGDDPVLSTGGLR
ncbi:MAG TPA: glucosyltransferase domain-containing protein, partial [Myxococcaceae bacterium]|nr:glucosyltransferase domain-containing protein [Myxococcaceae bacterium]